MDRKILVVLAVLSLAFADAGFVEGKGFDTNSLSQDTQIPDIPSPSAPTFGKTSAPISVQTPLATPTLTAAPSLPALPGLNQNLQSLNKPEYKMATFKDRTPEYRGPGQGQAAKKKRNLWEEIEYEVSHYGLFLLLGFAVVLMVYALRREAAEHAPAPSVQKTEKKDKKEEKKPGLWEEPF